MWRHSFLAEYLILNSNNDEVIPIVPKGKPEKTKLQYAQWVPNTSMIIYVYENNVYLRKNVLDQSQDDVQLTKDGIKDTIYNGIPDWVLWFYYAVINVLVLLLCSNVLGIRGRNSQYKQGNVF